MELSVPNDGLPVCLSTWLRETSFVRVGMLHHRNAFHACRWNQIQRVLWEHLHVFGCGAISAWNIHQKWIFARLEVFSSMFRPPLNQLNLTKSQAKEVCLPVVLQVFHIPLDDVNFCRRSVLHCFVSAVTQTLWTIQKQQHRFTLLAVLRGREKKEMEIFFSNYSRESELASLLLSAEFVWVSLM